ncbi:Hypothetical protein R9X50_00557800 [Acrodontium crateriforme]|uniref:Uncharacterized protein n=1 Tax=Acrodontium crateriforme TaxID=150365 RepID=A0AAQ3M7F5_9PEZI|nr:Hypothetical protein R9X50_00557800 [Acrodontium crateriforme]
MACEGYAAQTIFRDSTRKVQRRSQANEIRNLAAQGRRRHGRTASSQVDPILATQSYAKSQSFVESDSGFSSDDLTIEAALNTRRAFTAVQENDQNHSEASTPSLGLDRSHDDHSDDEYTTGAEPTAFQSTTCLGPNQPFPQQADQSELFERSRHSQSLQSGLTPSAGGTDISEANFEATILPSRSVIETDVSPTDSTRAVNKETLQSLEPTGDDQMDDVWLSHHFPGGLFPAFQTVWETVGYANPALKSALLALLPIPLATQQLERRAREQRLQCYSVALQKITYQRHHLQNMADVAVSLTTLCLVLIVEQRMGSFSGGLIHCRASDELVTYYLPQLTTWSLGQQILCAWICIRCWYDTQFEVWRTVEGHKTESLRDRVRPVLKHAQDKSFLLVSLLSDSVQVTERIILARLIGPNALWPSFRPWVSKLELLGLPAPDPIHGVFFSGSETKGLQRLATIRKELEAWHASLGEEDKPMSSSARSSGIHTPTTPTPTGFDPLYFRTDEAAMNYLRYAAAQHACDTSNMDHLTGGALDCELSLNRWMVYCMRIISGLATRGITIDDQRPIGVVWIICRVILMQAPTQQVFDSITSWSSWLLDLATLPGSICPSWLLRDTLTLARREQQRGCHLLLSYSDLSPAKERLEIYSGIIDYRYLLTGRDRHAGTVYFNVVSSPDILLQEPNSDTVANAALSTN